MVFGDCLAEVVGSVSVGMAGEAVVFRGVVTSFSGHGGVCLVGGEGVVVGVAGEHVGVDVVNGHGGVEVGSGVGTNSARRSSFPVCSATSSTVTPFCPRKKPTNTTLTKRNNSKAGVMKYELL